MTSSSPEFFVSHASEDRAFVESEILPRLKEIGLTFWYSEKDVGVGRFHDDILEGLHACPYFMVVCSRSAVKSAWVRDEVNWALMHRSKIWVVVAETCDIEKIHLGLLGHQCANYVKDPKRARELLDEWLREIAPPREQLVLTVIGAKGGVGKSTIACRMGEMIAETGHNVLLIDLDTGATGMTHMYTEHRRMSIGGSVSVHQFMDAAADEKPLPANATYGVDVTSPYLARAQGSGRVILMPAVGPEDHMRRSMTEIISKLERLRQQDSADASGRSIVFARVLEDILTRCAGGASFPIHCTILDCGAEGSEFNPFVDAAMMASRITYIVVQPDAICQKNVERLRYLATSLGGPNAAAKLRIVLNRVFSEEQHKPVAYAAFGSMTIAGHILNDENYFGAVQLGRVNLEEYDTISSGVRMVLAHRSEIPMHLVPTEDDLWVRRLTRLFVEGKIKGLRALFEQHMGKGPRIVGALGIVAALIGVALLVASLSPLVRDGQVAAVTIPVPVVILWIGSALGLAIGAALITIWRRARRQLDAQLAALSEMDKMMASSPQPQQVLLDEVRRLTSDANNEGLSSLRSLAKAVATGP